MKIADGDVDMPEQPNKMSQREERKEQSRHAQTGSLRLHRCIVRFRLFFVSKNTANRWPLPNSRLATVGKRNSKLLPYATVSRVRCIAAVCAKTPIPARMTKRIPLPTGGRVIACRIR